MGGNRWEGCVGSSTKNMGCRAPLHTYRPPVALLVLPRSCAGGEGREWEAGVRLWGVSQSQCKHPTLCCRHLLSWEGRQAPAPWDSHPGANPMLSPPCTGGVTKALRAHKKCLRSYLYSWLEGPGDAKRRRKTLGGWRAPSTTRSVDECVVFCPDSPTSFSWLT